MTRIEIADKISKNTGLELPVAKAAMEETISAIKESLKYGESVFLRGFGTFIAKERKAKIGRNITAGTSVAIPARKVPVFKAAKEFRKSVNS